MPRRETRPLVRAHVWLFADDLEWLKDRYEDKTGVSKALRQLISAFRKKVDAKVEAEMDREEVEETVVELPA